MASEAFDETTIAMTRVPLSQASSQNAPDGIPLKKKCARGGAVPTHTEAHRGHSKTRISGAVPGWLQGQPSSDGCGTSSEDGPVDGVRIGVKACGGSAGS